MTSYRLALVEISRRLLVRVPIGAVVVVAASLALGAAVVHPGLLRIVLLLGLLPALVGLGLWSPPGLIYGLAGWLVALGLVRRLIDTAASAASSAGFGDPLLLVGPAAMVVLTAIAARRGAFNDRSRAANAVLILNVLALVEVVNPLQGSLLVGAAGLLFLLVPMLAFWVGRSLVNDQTMRRLLVLVVVLAVPAVAYGLFQQFRGLPSWDEAWVVSSGYNALDVGGVIRAFGPFTAASEYATFLAVGVVVCAASWVAPRVAWVSVGVAGLLGVALIYESSRGIVVLGVLALAVMWAARHRLRPTLALLAGLAGLVLLFILASSVSSSAAQSASGSALVQHQLEGLANPLNTQDSTLVFHFSELLNGLRSALVAPFGHGTGSVSRAAAAFGGSLQGTEVDPSNFGVALGLPGLLAYLVVAASGLTAAYRLAVSRSRCWWVLAALGLLIVTFLQWGNGGQYAVAWLPWLVLGWVDRSITTEAGSFAPSHAADQRIVGMAA